MRAFLDHWVELLAGYCAFCALVEWVGGRPLEATALASAAALLLAMAKLLHTARGPRASRRAK